MKAAFLYHSLIRSTAPIKTNLNRQHMISVTHPRFLKTMASSDKGYIVVGLGGVTNGGKTTLCKQLKKHLQADVFNMDQYFWPEDSPNHTPLPQFNGHANWDTVSAVDFEKLLDDVNAWITVQRNKNTLNTRNSHRNTELPVLIVEGILVLNHKPLLDVYDHRFYVTLTKDECLERRKTRIYEPADPEDYFDQIVWPMYLKFKAHIDDSKDIITFIAGTQDRNITLENIVKEITN